MFFFVWCASFVCVLILFVFGVFFSYKWIQTCTFCCMFFFFFLLFNFWGSCCSPPASVYLCTSRCCDECAGVWKTCAWHHVCSVLQGESHSSGGLEKIWIEEIFLVGWGGAEDRGGRWDTLVMMCALQKHTYHTGDWWSVLGSPLVGVVVPSKDIYYSV